MKRLLTSEQTEEAIDRLYKAVVAELPKNLPVAIIGIRTRGETIAAGHRPDLSPEPPVAGQDPGAARPPLFRARIRGAHCLKAAE